MKNLIIIKLGGSVITYKESPIPKARTRTIKNLGLELIEIYKKDYRIILVHGGGSFGHTLAKKYHVNEGKIPEEPEEAFYQIAKVTQDLNNIIMDQFIKSELPVISLLPRNFVTNVNGKMQDFDFKIIKSLLDKNLIPVLCGDIVFDSKLFCSIVSGDTLISFLGKKLAASQVIFLSDVNGIFDKNPKISKDAKLIKEVNHKNLKKSLNGIEAGSRADVTGEMRGKILSIKKGLVNIKVSIINGQRNGNLTKTLKGMAVGTQLYFTNPSQES